MTKLLQQAIEVLRKLPPERQDELAEEGRGTKPGRSSMRMMRTFLPQMDSLPIEVKENSEIVKEQFAKAVRELIWADASLSCDGCREPHSPGGANWTRCAGHWTAREEQ